MRWAAGQVRSRTLALPEGEAEQLRIWSPDLSLTQDFPRAT